MQSLQWKNSVLYFIWCNVCAVSDGFLYPETTFFSICSKYLRSHFGVKLLQRPLIWHRIVCGPTRWKPSKHLNVSTSPTLLEPIFSPWTGGKSVEHRCAMWISGDIFPNPVSSVVFPKGNLMIMIVALQSIKNSNRLINAANFWLSGLFDLDLFDLLLQYGW